LLNYDQIDSTNELVSNFKINFSDHSFDNDDFPTYFNCSFYAFETDYSFVFKYRSYTFSENTPIYMWNGLIIEKRIDGKVN
jgi:hypothetical protein